MDNAKSYKEYLKDITTFIFDVDGVLTDGSLTIMTNGDLVRTMNVKDGYAIKQALNEGYNVCIISGGTNEGVKNRLENLGVSDVFLGAHQKNDFFTKYISDKAVTPEQVLYMGDDIPDIPVMTQVKLATCPVDAVAEVKAISNYISHKKGGKGCVRDVIEQVLKVQDKWHINSNAEAH